MTLNTKTATLACSYALAIAGTSACLEAPLVGGAPASSSTGAVLESTGLDDTGADSEGSDTQNTASEGSDSSGGPEVPAACSDDAPQVTGALVVDIAGTSARVEWDLSEAGSGFVEYGTTTSYGGETNREESFDFVSHQQTITGLDPSTTYHFRIHSGNAAGQTCVSSDSTFETLEHATATATFDEIAAAGRPENAYPTPTHYLAEFLEQRPDVCFWSVDEAAQTVSAQATPTPSASAIMLPMPSGGDDSAALSAIINAEAGREYVAPDGAVYTLNDEISVDVAADIYNLHVVALPGCGVMLRADAPDVRVFDSSFDMDNVASAYLAIYGEPGAHRLTVVNTEIKDMFHTGGNSGGGIRIRPSDDYHVTCNTFADLINDCTGHNSHPRPTCRANALWVQGSNALGDDNTANGGYFANNTVGFLQSNGDPTNADGSSNGGKDAEVFTVQGFETSGVDNILANRCVDGGKRLAKFQEGNGVVASNHFEWREAAGPLGQFTRRTVVAVHFEGGVMATNNRIVVNGDRHWGYVFLIARNADDVLFDNNSIEINSPLTDLLAERTLLRTDPDSLGTGNSLSNNIVFGRGGVNRYYTVNNSWPSSTLAIEGNDFGVPENN